MKTVFFFTKEKETDKSNFYIDLNQYDLKIIQIDFNNIIPSIEDLRNKYDLSHSILVSDQLIFIQLIFRLYNQSFENFVYTQSCKNEESIDIYSQEDKIFLQSITNEENIYKPLYVLNSSNITTHLNINLKYISKLEDTKINEKHSEFSQKVFIYNNKLFITEFFNFNYEIICLDNSSITDAVNVPHPLFNSEIKVFNYLNFFFKVLSNPRKNINDFVKEINLPISKLTQKEQLQFIIYFKFLIQYIDNEVIIQYLNSYLATLEFFTSKMFNFVLLEIIENKQLNINTKYFLFWQYFHINFTKELNKKAEQKYFWILYREIYNNYKKKIEGVEFIPKEKRNKNLIIIFTAQLLGESHSPTLLALSRAYNLIKYFKKEVLIINTAEIMSKKEMTAFYNVLLPHKNSSYNEINQITFKDISIPIYQTKEEMPDENELINILSIIQEYKPYFTINIGSSNLTADLSSNLITSVSFPTTSSLGVSESQIHINRQDLTIKNINLLKDINIDLESIVISQLGKEEVISKIKYTRRDFNLPENKFLIGIAGTRLKKEINNEFVSVLNNTLEYNTHIVFIGNFETYEEMCNNFPSMKEHSTLLEYQENFYDILKLFNLYVNPPRTGGGSGIYSLMHAIPIVTFNYGDIHNSTEGAFSVDSYSSMKTRILKNILDKAYYTEQSQLAKKIYNSKQTSIQSELENLLSEIETNKFFK